MLMNFLAKFLSIWLHHCSDFISNVSINVKIMLHYIFVISQWKEGFVWKPFAFVFPEIGFRTRRRWGQIRRPRYYSPAVRECHRQQARCAERPRLTIAGIPFGYVTISGQCILFLRSEYIEPYMCFLRVKKCLLSGSFMIIWFIQTDLILFLIYMTRSPVIYLC